MKLDAIVVALLAWGGTASAAPPLDDGPGGMTCPYYAAHARLAWLAPGGDWIDESGALHGERAADVQSAREGGAPRELSWDVTAVVRRWAEGRSAGALLLRATPGQRGGTLALRSREHSGALEAPALQVVWDDGSKDLLTPTADTTLSCSSRGSLGAQPTLKVSSNESSLLAFAFQPRDGRRVTRATLRLGVERVYGRGLSVGVFQARAPFDHPAPRETGLAARYVRDAGIRDDPDVIYADGFDSADTRRWVGLGTEGKAEVLAADPMRSLVPLDGKALRVTIARGVNQGLNAHFRFADTPGGEPDEAYFRYHLRLADDWNPVVDGGKLPGFSGTYGRGGWGLRKSDGRNGWSARGAFLKQETAAAGLRAIGSYVYDASTDGAGEVFGWNLGPTGLLEKNRWYSVEQHVRMNTPGRSDGVLRAWIDGRLVFERRDLHWRDVPELHIESVWLNVYHGGTQPAPSDMTLFIDNVVIARRYIGPVREAR